MASSIRSGKESDDAQGTLAVPDAIPQHMVANLIAAGVNPAAVSVPHVNFYSKVEWPELCTMSTKDQRTKVSPLLTITRIEWMPEAEERYKDYKGVVLAEFMTEFGDEWYVTHAMTYAATSEYLPLSAWLKSVTPPCLARFGRIETSKREQFIIRPVPWNIETV